MKPDLTTLIQSVPEEYRLNALYCIECIVAMFGSDIEVTSLYRTRAANEACGGSKTSAHLRAAAIDFRVSAIPIMDVAKFTAANVPDYDQIIVYLRRPAERSFMHLGFRDNPRFQYFIRDER